ncbi:hypothetical protein BDF20DRAFT_902672 [Mycotypha africana]|uniref:uncharacterized protein n=1 Tax=Mycotypha africana TaxID=64632 RepID=UPI002300DA4D|nr:uncharacterized protein BDF20DRAFT_902672 [Mycotypha africana]KAI8967119.1 hypothetical protein BDF20DRAFT_902672 [Mycotypha africana]
MAPVTEVDAKYTDHVHPWEEIVHYVSINQVDQLRRNREAQAIYQEWIKNTLKKYGTLENFLLKEKIHFPAEDIDMDDHDKQNRSPAILILPNDFPYSVEPGIEHILIWSKVPLSADFVESVLEEKYGSSKWEWIYFVNPPETQSVRRLPHVHVFMRSRKGKKQTEN